MKTIISVTWNECRRELCRRKFWLTVAALAALLLLDTLPSLSITEQGEYATDITTMALNAMNGSGYLFWLRFCLFVIPYGCGFYEEYSQKTAKYRLIRGSVFSYGTAKIITGILLTAASIFLSQIIFAFLLKMAGIPLLLPQQGEYDQNYVLYRMISEGKKIRFYLLISIFECFAGVYFSSMTIMLSSFIRNKYILFTIPLALFFNVDSFSGLLFPYPYGGQPDLTNWRVLFFSLLTNDVMTEKAAFIRTALYTAAFTAIFGIVFLCRIRKVVENE